MADNSISSSFVCAICLDQMKQPKFIGPCNHTFCKCCIQQLWVNRGRERTIPCPECRQECPIPRNGVDDLKDNFTLSTIMETYRNQPKRTGKSSEVACNMALCPNGASSVCKECDLKLCPGCKGQHDHNPDTRDHDLFGLCSSHGKGLLFFCSPCKQAVCSRCKASDHNLGHHGVKPIRPVVGELMRRIKASSAELEDIIWTQVEEEEKKLRELHAFAEEKSHFADVQVTAQEEKTIADKKNEIQGLNAVSQGIQAQVDVLLKKKEEVDNRSKQLVKDIEELKKNKTTLIAHARERFNGSFDFIDQRLQFLDTCRKEMNASLQQGRAMESTKITIDTKCIADMTNVSQELAELVRTSRESDSKTLIEEVRRTIGELVLDVDDIGQDEAGVRSPGAQQIIGSGKAKQEFKQLKKLSNLFSLSGYPLILCVSQIKQTLDNHLATLATLPRCASGTDVIFFHDNASSTFTGEITEGVHPACDMAISSTGELVVARNADPPIRVFNRATGAYRDINITLGGMVIEWINCVETDELNNMFVSSDYLLLVLNAFGNVIQRVQLSGPASKMAFSPATRVLYIAAKTKMLRFKWSNNVLKEISSSSHSVEGFSCRDVCVGSGGEVVVAGFMANMELVIYQVREGAVEKDLVLRQITCEDNARLFTYPHICIKDNHLWLGHYKHIDKFQLLV